VIATAYSGNVDFTNPVTACMVDYTLIPVGPDEYPHPEGQMWADPDVAQAARYMRQLVSDPRHAARLGRRGHAFVNGQHGVAAAGERYRARLEQIGFL
jgi:hypothetical protein